MCISNYGNGDWFGLQVSKECRFANNSLKVSFDIVGIYIVYIYNTILWSNCVELE